MLPRLADLLTGSIGNDRRRRFRYRVGKPRFCRRGGQGWGQGADEYRQWDAAGTRRGGHFGRAGVSGWVEIVIFSLSFCDNTHAAIRNFVH